MERAGIDGRSILIRGGRVVTALDDYEADVFIEGETVSQIGRSLRVAADITIDARDRYVLPGCIDPHTHFDSPYAGVTTSDDFTSGGISAAFGGTTSVIDFSLQLPGEPLHAAHARWRERTELHASVIDYGFHVTVTDVAVPDARADLLRLSEEGVTSFKLFMAPSGAISVDDQTLLATMFHAADAGALVLVHAENRHVIDELRRRMPDGGLHDPLWHARTHPPAGEAESVHRAIRLAGIAGAPLYVVHVSCGEASAEIGAARALGRPVWGETCTQYLYVDEEELALPGLEGARRVFTPPPRPRHQHEHLWTDLRHDTLQVVSTDHCPYFAELKAAGRDDFTRIPAGAPGVEDRLVMVFQGVREGRLSLQRLVQVLATNPARLFGLYPRKGAVAVGSDADLVVFDPAREWMISVQTHHSQADYNLYEGRRVVGAPEVVLVRGRVVVDRGELVCEPGHGRYLARERFDAAAFGATA